MYVVVLNFYLFVNPFFEGGKVEHRFIGLAHSYVDKLELFLHKVIGFFNEPSDFLDRFFVKLKLLIDLLENSKLKYLWVIGNHHRQLLNLLGVSGLDLLDFGQTCGMLHDSFLKGS